MKKEIKVLSIKEPHATLLLTPYKTIETRSWATSYRGEIFLHASRAIPAYNTANREMWDRVYRLIHKEENRTGKAVCFRNGYIYAKATLVNCVLMTPENIAELGQDEIDAGYYEPGRYMWIMNDIVPFEEGKLIPAKGHLGIWRYEYDTEWNDNNPEKII